MLACWKIGAIKGFLQIPALTSLMKEYPTLNERKEWMYGCAPGCADSHIALPTPRVPRPVCFSALTAVNSSPYRDPKVPLLVVSGCCHAAAPVVIQVCCEPRTKRTTPFFKKKKKNRKKLKERRSSWKGSQRRTSILKGESENHRARRGALKPAPASPPAVTREHSGLCVQPNGAFLAIYPRLPGSILHI